MDAQDPITSLAQLPGLKGGLRDPQFWITLLAFAAGTVLIARGQDMIGGILMSVATGSSHLADGLAKAGVHSENVKAQAFAPKG